MYGTYFLIKQAFFQYQKGSLTFSCQSLLMAALGNAFPLLLIVSSQILHFFYISRKHKFKTVRLIKTVHFLSFEP